jgi:hypothetical protein
MSADKTTLAVIEALKQGMAQPGEHRLYKSGKLAGLFPGRTGAHIEAAAQALRDGFLEVVRTETKGKAPVEWVKLTQKGMDFLLSHESPARAMDELREALEMTKEGLPAWLAQIRRSFQEQADKLVDEVKTVLGRLESLSIRISEALQRAEASAPKLPAKETTAFPWALEALTYLDRRKDGGAPSPCPLPDLFAAVRARDHDLTMNGFHAGLRSMQERGVLELLPFAGSPEELPEPEYALLDGTTMYYYVTR